MNLQWIHRIDHLQSCTHCWKVSVKRRNKCIHKYFSDTVYCGKDAALKAAIAYRNELLKKISGGVHYVIWRRKLKKSNNTSGIVGIARYERKSRNEICWNAFWNDADGKRHTHRFSVNKYGENGAKARAYKARQEGLMTLKQALKNRLEKQTRGKPEKIVLFRGTSPRLYELETKKK